MASAPPRHLRIFLASPGDVLDEREIALQVLDGLPYDPLLRGKVTIEDVAWDKRGAGAPLLAGVTPQDSIARGLPLPADCDIVVVLFWSRMGTPLPPPYQKKDGSPYESGTEWEYENAVTAFRKHGSPYVLLYRRTGVTLDPDAHDFEERRAQYEKVKRFFADPSIGGYTRYDTPGDFREQLEHDVRSLIKRMLDEQPHTAPASQVPLPEPWKGSPFPGLRAFTADDAPIFFGREREIDALVARVHEQPFVAVVGASGSGKSSLVAAGVIPRLQLTAGSAGAEKWLVLQLTPDRLGTGDPFASLAAAVLHALPETQQKGLAAKLREDPELLASLLPPRTLVFVDQFEELFTTVQPSLRAPFIDALGRVRTIITVRADFYGHCVEIPAFAELVKDGTYPLGAPGVAALYDMITRPAARAALTFEEGLPQRILDDTGQESGALALMAYTLDELYRRGLTYAAYEGLGGVQGAIGKRSESVFAELGEQEQAALPRVFRELVEVDERGTGTRQRAPRAHVAATPTAKRLTDALTEARLLVQSRGDDGEPVVEVAHDALFRSWIRLADWIRDAADDLRLLRQVRNAAVEWDRSGRRDDFLWSHERLAPVYVLRDRLNLDFEEVVAEFIRPESERIATAVRLGLSEGRELAAVERLAEIGPLAARSLVACLEYARGLKARSDIHDALSRVRDAAVPHLLDAAINAESRGRRAAVEVLTEIDPGAGAPLLPRLLADEETAVRIAAIFLVAHARSEPDVSTLCRIIRTDTRDVQSAAIFALTAFDSQATLDHLLWALESGDSLADLAIELIARLAGRDAPITAVFTKDDSLLPLIAANPVLRRLPALIQVATALARLSAGDGIAKRIRSTLRLLLSSKWIEASVSADSSEDEIERLFEIMRNARSIAIVNMLSSADARLQWHAVRSIAAEPDHFSLIGVMDIRGPLYGLLRHDDKQVADTAREALKAIERLRTS